MTAATSSSDRYAEARAALAEFDRQHPEERYSTALENRMSDALRALIEPPATVETPEKIADRLFDQVWGSGLRESLRVAVRVGIQSAWESWEPDDYAPRPELELWARDAADAMFSDKSNDWSEELTQLRTILGEPEGWKLA